MTSFNINMDKVCKLTQEKLWTITELTRKAGVSLPTYILLEKSAKPAV